MRLSDIWRSRCGVCHLMYLWKLTRSHKIKHDKRLHEKRWQWIWWAPYRIPDFVSTVSRLIALFNFNGSRSATGAGLIEVSSSIISIFWTELKNSHYELGLLASKRLLRTWRFFFKNDNTAIWEIGIIEQQWTNFRCSKWKHALFALWNSVLPVPY